MDNFGVTHLGVPSFIKYYQREDFVEPLNMPVSSHLIQTDVSGNEIGTSDEFDRSNKSGLDVSKKFHKSC